MLPNGVPVEFEDVPCDVCGSTSATALFDGPDRLLGLSGTFTVVRCADCGLIRQNPRPTAATIGYYYPSSYEPYALAIDDEPSRWRRWDRRYGMAKRCRSIERLQPAGRLLDVGCATGIFLSEMQRRGGWQTEGVEPNAEAAAYARDRLGLVVHNSRLPEANLPASSFDVITLWNVLEHMHDPLVNLREIARLLRPGGLFVFSIPNMASLEAGWFGPYWLGWELPRHLCFFSQPVMERALGRLGLDVLRWDCLVGAYPSFVYSLRFFLTDPQRRNWWTRPALGLAGSAPVRALTAPAFWLLTRANRATLITGFARRELA